MSDITKNSTGGFSEAQKQYLAGFTFGADVARAVSGLPVLSGRNGNPTRLSIGGEGPHVDDAPVNFGPDALGRTAQDAVIAAGGKLCKEELAKRDQNGLDVWDAMQARANAGEFPKGNDVFLSKYHGVFYVAPAQNAYMCRMRIPGGSLRGWQLHGIAEVADRCAGGAIDITTRANLQLREIPATMPMEVLYGLRELDITCQGSGADNIRNCTASPLSGIDASELIETLPLAKRMHQYILAHRELYGLPRKFNIAFDGGGRVSSLGDTNDVGFHAVRVCEQHASEEVPAGIYFQLALGGITGHQDFARETGILLKPLECIEVAAAIVKVFILSGERTDRNKARLKYVLDAWGFDKFIKEVEQTLGRPLRKVANRIVTVSHNEDRQAHVGVHPQKQSGKYYIGVVLPVGRLSSAQARTIASLADRYGGGEIRLTVWQNLILPNISKADLPTVKEELRACGLDYEASSFRSGLVACTGNAGCKYAAADTKRHAMILGDYLQSRFKLDQPINIHLTGCHHSCAQHYIGDIGLLACKVEQDEDLVEGYHVFIGGGWGERQAIGRSLFHSVTFGDCLPLLAGIIGGYLEHCHPGEDFSAFASRTCDEQLKAFACGYSFN